MLKPLRKFVDDWHHAEAKHRAFMIGGGLLFLFALVGLALPLVPQVPFAIGAALLFARGSPSLHRWMRKNKKMGQFIRDWEDHEVLRPKLKIVSTLAMMGGAAIGHWKIDALELALTLDAVFLAAILFVISRQGTPPVWAKEQWEREQASDEREKRLRERRG